MAAGEGAGVAGVVLAGVVTTALWQEQPQPQGLTTRTLWQGQGLGQPQQRLQPEPERISVLNKPIFSPHIVISSKIYLAISFYAAILDIGIKVRQNISRTRLTFEPLDGLCC